MYIPKKILYLIAGVVVLGGVIFATGYLGNGTGSLLDKIEFGVKSNELVRVERVIDGDTIKVEVGGQMESVRYIGIDTPETVDPRLPVECFGVEASKRNEELVGGQLVRLERDLTNRDKYGRLLRYVWLDDVLINEALVEQGFAQAVSYPPDVRYQERFTSAEKEARTGGLGLWSACE